MQLLTSNRQLALFALSASALLLTACHTPPATQPLSAASAAPASAVSKPSPQPAPSPRVAAPPTSVTPSTFPAGKELVLFDGKTLKGWRVTDFAGAAPVHIEPAFHGNDPAIVLDQGIMTGITWTNDLPRQHYEITLEAMRVSGGDFFCGLTFPVGNDPCSFILGGWGGGVVGLSSVDSEDAAHNETTKYMKFENGRWYRVRVKVTPEAIQAWIDDESMVNLKLEDRTLSIRMEVESSKPLGISTWSTTGALRNLRMRSLPAH